MALIKCLGCGQLISDKALNCPKCGRANNREESVVKNSENKIKEFNQIKKDNYEQDKLPVEISAKRNEINKNEESANQKSKLPKILFGLIIFGSSVLGFNFISNEIKFADSPCNRSCGGDCIIHFNKMVGSERENFKTRRWARMNDIKEYGLYLDACVTHNNGRAAQRYYLKMHQKYLNRDK